MTREVIDIVIPWVDGDDPVLAAKRRQYLTGKREDKHADVAAATRYCDLGVIFWCIDSINIFAPFIRKIFIVTDGQDPHLEEHLTARFPKGHIPVEIVDHSVIFKGYEKYLPTFNSRSIEALIWRIPGLSEHFLLMNDDFFLAGPDLVGKDVQENKTMEEQARKGHIQGFDDQCGEDSRRSSAVPLSCAHTTCIETQFL